MRVAWDLPYAGGPVWCDKPDEEVLSFCESLIKLGFSPVVTQE